MSFADFEGSDDGAAELYFGSYEGDRNDRDERHGQTSLSKKNHKIT